MKKKEKLLYSSKLGQAAIKTKILKHYRIIKQTNEI